MPYCTQCGTQAADDARFCLNCGAPQHPSFTAPPRQNAGTPPPPRTSQDSISPRTAATMCYIPIAGWVPSVWVLAADRFRGDKQTRFHAFQGLYLFVAWLVLDWAVSPILGFHAWRHITFTPLFKAIIWVAWIVMLIKTSKGEDFHLPLFGDLADRSLSEQR